VDHWLNKRPFDAPAKAAPKPVGRVLVIGAGPAGLAAARHLQVTMILLNHLYISFSKTVRGR